MKQPQRPPRGGNRRRAIAAIPPDVDLNSVADRVNYIGSSKHVNVRSWRGIPPRPEPDASLCPPELVQNRQAVLELLRAAILAGHTGGEWNGGFPEYAWCRWNGSILEARLTNAGLGEYKGYPLHEFQTVQGLPE
jgi:hypothetical protein